MVGTVIFKLSETPDGDGQQVILSQVASDDVKELEDFANSVARYCDSLSHEEE